MDFKTLGALEVSSKGQVLELGSPRQRALLARLLVDANEPVSTDRLVDDLWPANPPETARHMLHVYVSGLRKALGTERIELNRDRFAYRLVVNEDELDIDRFERGAAAGRKALSRGDAMLAATHLKEALDQWNGGFLEEFADEDFTREVRARLDDAHLSALEARLAADLELGRHSDSIEELSELVREHPFRERLWELLMVAFYRAGRQTDALRAFQDARAVLAAELGIDPGPAMKRLEEQILSQDPSLEIRSSTLEVRDSGRLPMQRTSFVGRETDLALGADLLEKSRLVTLTGPPGSGKTRLALRLASDHEHDFAHGVFFVSLAAVTDPDLVDTTIARTLGLRDAPGETPAEGLAAFLRDRSALLVLDNFEQVLGSRQLVGHLIDSAPELKVIVTSRAPLAILGEQEFPVKPLTVPAIEEDLDHRDLIDNDAVALFVARARASTPAFELTADNADTVVQIIKRLDGLPLAIELAAARTRLLTPLDLLNRLEESLRVLIEAPADAEERHRTLEDAIRWSYDLLESDQQALFRGLSVFRDFSIESAADVLGIPEPDALLGVDSLLLHSLLFRTVEVGEARFGMLETIREFASAVLEAEGEADELAQSHARYFLDYAQRVAPRLIGESQRDAINSLLREIDNLRLVLSHSIDEGRPDIGLLLAGGAWRLWHGTGQLSEGRRWLGQLLDLPGADEEAKAVALTGLAGLAYWQADFEETWSLYEEALEIYRRRRDRYEEAETLASMSMTATWRGDSKLGEQLASEAEQIFEGLGLEEPLGRIYMARAWALSRRGDQEAALPFWEAALESSRKFGDRALAITQLISLGTYQYHQGNHTEALRIGLEALDEAVELQNVQLAVWMIDFVAGFAAEMDLETAVRLSAAAQAMRHMSGGGMLTEATGIRPPLEVAAAAWDGEPMRSAVEDGSAWSLDDAIEAARGLKRLTRVEGSVSAH